MWFFLPISEQTYWEFADDLKEWMARPEAERADKVELILADGSVYPHKGKFAFVGRYVDEKTGTIQIAISFPNPELTLRPGQFGRARAEIKTIPNALLIPQQALSQLQGYDQVAVVNPDGKAEIRAVKVGQLYGRNMIVVTEGLKLGEKVIVEGFQRVRQGMEVSAKPFTDTSTTQGAQNDSERNSTTQSVSVAADQKSGESGVRPSG
jgi:membrane fusion protein (multidrug efflux system)